MSIQQSIQNGKFTLIVEFTPHSSSDIKNVLEIAKALPTLSQKYASKDITIPGIALTQNPGGALSYDHQASFGILKENRFPEELEIMPHITGKDMNVDAIKTLLLSLGERGIQTILALTGDKPLQAKGVFEIGSLGVLELMKEVNFSLLRSSKSPQELVGTNILHAGAAVSPFKYTDGALAMQYIKASKKIRAGASFLICQAGWDAERSEDLIKALQEENTPIIGNVLVVNHPAAKYMQTLPGCVIDDDFLDRLKGEKKEDNLKRAGQQMAMFRDLGYAGAQLGKPGDFKSIDEIEAVIEQALQTSDWHTVRENLSFPVAQSSLSKFKKSTAFSNAVHGLAFKSDSLLHGVTKAVLSPFNSSAKREGALYKLFRSMEDLGKGLMYECQHCGDCFLPENEYLCTKGACEKGLSNPPCGDADAKGYCGNNNHRICVGERVYYRMLHDDKLEEFKKTVHPSRNPELQNSSSVLNFFFDRDHTTKQTPLEGSGLIQIGEMLHASISLPGAAMKHMLNMGEKAFTKPNPGLLVLERLILNQVRQGADYLDINIDELGILEGANTLDLMRQYVQLVHCLGNGVPPCVDSSNIDVIRAGLEKWFQLTRTGASPGEQSKPKPPLANSIPFFHMDRYDAVYDLRKDHSFGVICLLIGDKGPLESTAEMVDAAQTMFERARKAGFRPEQIYFDTVTLGVAIDSYVDSMGKIKPSHTFNSFHAIQKIRQDKQMKGVHAILGVSNWAHGVKNRRIGHVRSFISVAQKYGLDAVIADVEKQFGVRPVAPELAEFVMSYMALDGNEESGKIYNTTMTNARKQNMI